jgi:large subunit ribosomal protein L3
MFMALGMLGLKVGMTQIYDDKGNLCPVTVLEVGPNPILQIRTPEVDGYHAVQVGFIDKPREKATLPERGHVANNIQTKRRAWLQAAGVQIPEKADCEPQRFIREFRLDQASDLKVGGALIATEIFKDTKRVDVIGTSKGHGTTGSMKRHGFSGLPASHGVKKHHRSPGSIGSHASNRGSGRPKLGHKAAGRHGNSRVTVRNLDIVKIDGENHLILVRGAVPGPNGGLVMIRPTNKKA